MVGCWKKVWISQKNFAFVIRNFIFNFVHLWFDNHRAVVVLLVMEVVVVVT